MDCLCIIDNLFNFTIDLKEEYLIFTDFSKWSLSLEELIQNQVTQEIEVSLCEDEDICCNDPKNINTTTNQKLPTKKITILPGRSTIIYYKDLFNTDCDIDGVYLFKITTCDDTQILSRKYSILKYLICAYKQLLLKNDWDNAFKLLQNIEMIKSESEINNFDKVKTLYEISIRFIKKFNCNCDE